MSINMKRLITMFSIVLVMFLLISCDKDEEENTGYDGRTFDISAAQDGSVTAKTTKVGNNYEIVLSGNGETISYSKKEAVPWNAISKKIVSVEIEEGIENIGDYYFYSVTLDEYYIPSSITKVEANSFNSSAVIYSYSTNQITVKCENKVYYYSETKPSTSGDYWHMVGDKPLLWKQYKIMFIGNSFTYYPTDVYGVNNPGVCALTKEIANSLGMNLTIDFVVKGSHSLKKFASATDEMGAIVDQKLKAASDYDYIILQEQSTTPVNDYNAFSSGVTALVNKINETQKNCEVILYATWGFPSGVSTGSIFSSVPAMEALIREAYEKCAGENNLRISHVGEAFTYVYENYANINLYWSDDKHQSYAGAYLSACVHLSTILGVDVRGASFRGNLNATTAETLQNVAYDIVFN